MTDEGVWPKTSGSVLYASEVNSMFDMVPVGSVTAWLKTYTNTPTLPDNWVECNGQTLDDADSVYDTQTLPDLNASSGTARFLRGATTSGGTGGYDTQSSVTTDVRTGNATNNKTTVNTAATKNLPPYYAVVWIMRIK